MKAYSTVIYNDAFELRTSLLVEMKFCRLHLFRLVFHSFLFFQLRFFRRVREIVQFSVNCLVYLYFRFCALLYTWIGMFAVFIFCYEAVNHYLVVIVFFLNKQLYLQSKLKYFCDKMTQTICYFFPVRVSLASRQKCLSFGACEFSGSNGHNLFSSHSLQTVPFSVFALLFSSRYFFCCCCCSWCVVDKALVSLNIAV